LGSGLLILIMVLC